MNSLILIDEYLLRRGDEFIAYLYHQHDISRRMVLRMVAALFVGVFVIRAVTNYQHPGITYFVMGLTVSHIIISEQKGFLFSLSNAQMLRLREYPGRRFFRIIDLLIATMQIVWATHALDLAGVLVGLLSFCFVVLDDSLTPPGPRRPRRKVTETKLAWGLT